MRTDPNVEAIRGRLRARSLVGIEKYGVTTERTDYRLLDWLQHLQEELLDAAVYIEAARSLVIDAPVRVRNGPQDAWQAGHFAGFTATGRPTVFAGGRTSWTCVASEVLVFNEFERG